MTTRAFAVFFDDSAAVSGAHFTIYKQANRFGDEFCSLSCVRSSVQIALNVDVVFSLLVIVLVGDIQKREENQKSDETCHEYTQVVNFFIDIVVRPTCHDEDRKK